MPEIGALKQRHVKNDAMRVVSSSRAGGGGTDQNRRGITQSYDGERIVALPTNAQGSNPLLLKSLMRMFSKY